MQRKYRRHLLKSKQSKLILNELSERLKVEMETLLGSKPIVEILEVETSKIYLVNGKPFFFKIEDRILPTLLFGDLISQAPKIVVDMGAVPYVCNGADIMAPGIVRIEGEFSEGDLVLIVDEKHDKPLALGESLYDSQTAGKIKQGALAKNLHFVSDKIWNLVKAFTE
jgi:PUA-domain protein